MERRIPTDGTVPLYGLYTVAEDGTRNAVSVQAASRQIQELEAEIAGLYSKKITDPYVTIRVTEHAPKIIYVSGGVTTPREYTLPNDLRITLVQALTMAGWFKVVKR